MNTATLELPRTLEGVQQELSRIERRMQRLRWANDPVLWAKERLGDTLWSGQRRILYSVRDHRKTAAATCHEIGKTYDAGLAAAWWIDIHKAGEAYVITTAPTAPQVRIILWKEIGRAHQRGNLAGRINQMEWMMKVGDKEESVGIGRKPSDYSPAAFQGVHAPFVLVIVDEANGVRGPLWDALDSIMANDDSKMLAIGNPDEPAGEFFEACKPGSGFNVVHLSAFDSPNFTGEALPSSIRKQLVGHRYVEERRNKWARTWHWIDADGKLLKIEQPGIEAPKGGVRVVPPEGGGLEDTHPFWQSKVLGQFPVQSAAGSLIPLSWIRAAQERTLEPIGLNELSLDVGASEHGDPSCCGHRRGPVFRILYEERQPDTMKTAGKLIQHLGDKKYGATRAKVDYIGVGRGVVDRAREQNLPVYPISVGEASTIHSCRVCKHEWDQSLMANKQQTNAYTHCPKCGSDQVWKVFADALSQFWWSVRGLFESEEIDIDERDDQLAEELLLLRWAPNSKGQTKVFYADGPSPNRADALMIAYAPVVEIPKGGSTLVW